MMEPKEPGSVNSELFRLAKKFRFEVQPPSALEFRTAHKECFDKLVKEITEWIELNREALLLAWFAQYGFEPGKAVLVESHENGRTNLYIREATEEEKNQRRRD